MKIKWKINKRRYFKPGDKVRVREDCEWEWPTLRNKTWTVDYVSNFMSWKGTKCNIERPGLRLKSKSETGYYDSFGFEHI